VTALWSESVGAYGWLGPNVQTNHGPSPPLRVFGHRSWVAFRALLLHPDKGSS